MKSYNTSQAAVNSKISDAATDVYSRIYGQFNSNKDALDYLRSNKGRVVAQMTQAGMTPNDAMNYYLAMEADLKNKGGVY